MLPNSAFHRIVDKNELIEQQDTILSLLSNLKKAKHALDQFIDNYKFMRHEFKYKEQPLKKYLKK